MKINKGMSDIIIRQLAQDAEYDNKRVSLDQRFLLNEIDLEKIRRREEEKKAQPKMPLWWQEAPMYAKILTVLIMAVLGIVTLPFLIISVAAVVIIIFSKDHKKSKTHGRSGREDSDSSRIRSAEGQ
ncbi:hypothetical protein WJR50_33015 [Catalinimonas sp. 4WD22]|uniref:hypothetical protein n=1 Tax=Catalinimonas locisalis TaxID=3133978 RepID=UPI0031016E3C